MPSAPRAIAKKLSAYEKDQVAEIAGWKAQPVNPIAEVWNVVVLQAARLATIFVPTAVARSLIELSYRAAFAISPPESIARHAGVRNLRQLRKRPLEECDQLARHAALGSELMALYEGAMTGLGGPLTTLIDVPILFISALRSIIRTGQSYGYPAEEPNDRFFNLGILTVATAGSLATRLERLDQLQDLEELLVRETQVEMIRSELMSFLFQLEIFEDIPGIGVISGGLSKPGFHAPSRPDRAPHLSRALAQRQRQGPRNRPRPIPRNVHPPPSGKRRRQRRPHVMLLRRLGRRLPGGRRGITLRHATKALNRAKPPPPHINRHRPAPSHAPVPGVKVSPRPSTSPQRQQGGFDDGPEIFGCILRDRWPERRRRHPDAEHRKECSRHAASQRATAAKLVPTVPVGMPSSTLCVAPYRNDIAEKKSRRVGETPPRTTIAGQPFAINGRHSFTNAPPVTSSPPASGRPSGYFARSACHFLTSSGLFVAV